MSAFKYYHVHLRSPDPEETARYYEKMFGAEIIRSVQSDGRERIDLDLGGLTVFIAKADPDKVGAPPEPPFQGLEHLGLAVHPIDEAVAELKKKGAEGHTRADNDPARRADRVHPRPAECSYRAARPPSRVELPLSGA